MGQIVKRKKKGRPSKADLARRAEEEAAAAAAEPDVRRSLRRRNVRYNIDYDDYLEEDDEDEEEDERRREKKLKLVVKLNQGSEPLTPTRGRSETREGPASEDECERKPLKKRRIGGGRDEDDEEQEEDDEDDHVGVACDDEEERGRKLDSKGLDSAPGTPSDYPFGARLPDKKILELILDKLQKKDTYGVYAEPVDPEELPDYHDVIEHPMDFATVRKKLANGSYPSLEQFEGRIGLKKGEAVVLEIGRKPSIEFGHKSSL